MFIYFETKRKLIPIKQKSKRKTTKLSVHHNQLII
jgi:hypothetical protein